MPEPGQDWPPVRRRGERGRNGMSEPIVDETGQALCAHCGEPLTRTLADVHLCELCERAYS